jgi:hypothetical protein
VLTLFNEHFDDGTAEFARASSNSDDSHGLDVLFVCFFSKVEVCLAIQIWRAREMDDNCQGVVRMALGPYIYPPHKQHSETSGSMIHPHLDAG